MNGPQLETRQLTSIQNPESGVRLLSPCRHRHFGVSVSHVLDLIAYWVLLELAKRKNGLTHMSQNNFLCLIKAPNFNISTEIRQSYIDKKPSLFI